MQQKLLFENKQSDLDMFTANELLAAYMKRVPEIKVNKINSPADTYPLLCKHGADKQESFFAIYLNGGHEVIVTKTISQGTLNKTIVHPREVFRYAVLTGCAGIILAHNHPSGALGPSTEDRVLTKRMKEAGDVMGIEILDHVIFSKTGYYSFLEEGVM